MSDVRQTLSPVPETLERSLSNLAARHRKLAGLEGLGLAAALVICGLGVLGWADFLIELPPGLRAVALALVAGGAVAAAVLIRRAARRLADPTRLAARLDRHGNTGGEVLAGTELALQAPGYADPVTKALALEAAEAAGRRALAYAPPEVIPGKTARKPWIVAAASAAAMLFAALIWPSVFSAQALRLLDPFGDHPPYSPYDFAVDPGDAKVRFSDPFTIQVTARGERLPSKVDWVVERDDGTNAVYPMIDQGEGKYAGTIGVVEAPFRYHVRGSEGRSRGFKVGVILTPRFERVEARLDWPAYTRRATFEGPYPEGGLVGVKRTKVTLTAVSNRPLASGKLVWKDSKDPAVAFEPRMGPEGKADRVVGTFDISHDGHFELSIVDKDGNACREPFQGRVVLLGDRRPTVSILEPPAESFATPTAVVPVVMEAEDDFGLSRAALFRSLNGTRDHALELPIPPNAAMPVRLDAKLALKEWSLEPGDVLEFYALVADNDPDGAKTAQSKVHRLRIISEEDFQKFQQQQQDIDDLVEKFRPINEALEKAKEEAKKLDEALQKLDKAEGPEAEKARKDAREAKARLKEALEEAERLAREQSQQAPVFEIEKDFKKELEKLARDLEAMGKEAEEGMKELDPPLAPGAEGKPKADGKGRKSLAQLRKKLGDSSEEFQEQVELPLDVLEKIYRLMEYESRFTALALAQEDLARRAKRFADRDKVENAEEREELRGLAEEQRGLEEELREVIQGIRDAAGKLPKGEPFDDLRQQAEEFATEVVEAKAPEALAKALQSLEDRLGKKSAEDTQKAAELLMSFVKKCEGMGQQGQKACLKFQPSLANGMSRTLNQLLAGKGLPMPGAGNATGQGMAGRGGSSSAQRAGGQVGLYGNRPMAGKSGGGRGKKGEGGAGKDSSVGGSAGDRDAASSRTDLLYGGVPIEAIPGEYRAAVREFFRRVVEESGREGR